WPLARTQWTRFYLEPDGMRLAREAPRSAKTLSYDPLVPAQGNGLTFSMVVQEETEITGPSVLKLFASSATSDADFFIVLRVFEPSGKEVLFQGRSTPRRRSPRAGCAPRTASSIRRR